MWNFYVFTVFDFLVKAREELLWTNAGVDQNFQTNLGAIDPYEFQGKFVWTNGSHMPCFQGNLYGAMALKVRQKSHARCGNSVFFLSFFRGYFVAISFRYF